MIYIKCSKCSNVHNPLRSDSFNFSVCGCGGLMKLIRIADEQHRKAVSALRGYLNALVTSSLERVQELTKNKKMHEEFESWSANWLLKNSDARSWEGIDSVCVFMRWYRDAGEVDEIFEAADWAVSVADAAERAVSWFEEGKVREMLWWLDSAVFNAETAKGLSSSMTLENYRTRKAEVLALLKENGYEVVI